jgi:hypothetical protein
MVGGLRLERWAPSRQNDGRHQIGIGGRLTSESATNVAVVTGVLALLGGCAGFSQPRPTAFERDVGPASITGGLPRNDMAVGSGDQDMPDVSSAGTSGITRH